MDHMMPDHMIHIVILCYRFWSEWGVGFVMFCHHRRVSAKPTLAGDGADSSVRGYPTG